MLKMGKSGDLKKEQKKLLKQQKEVQIQQNFVEKDHRDVRAISNDVMKVMEAAEAKMEAAEAKIRKVMVHFEEATENNAKIKQLEDMVLAQQEEIANLKNDNKKIKAELFHYIEKNEAKENEKRNRNVILKNVSKEEATKVLSKVMNKPMKNKIRFITPGDKSVKVGLKSTNDVLNLCSKSESKSVKRDLSKLTRIKKFILGK